MKIGRFQLQHFVNAFEIDLVGGLDQLCGRAICTTELQVDELLAVFVEQFKCIQVRADGDLHQLSKAISDLCDGQRAQEGEIQKGMDWGMV